MSLTMKIYQFLLFAVLSGIFKSSSSSPSWGGQWDRWHQPSSYQGPGHRDYGHHEHSYECKHDRGHEPDEHPSPGGEQGCSCLLFVGEQQVFSRKADASGWYSCSGLGLYRCAQYCDELFQDESLRYRSRQDACDVIGQEIFTPWYRKNQVCGYYGPYEDIPLNVDLCCRRGRPSEECTNAAQT